MKLKIPESISLDLLKRVAKEARSKMAFTAKGWVGSASIGPDRTLCHKGDEIQVVKWYCYEGPTVIKVNGRETCIPFGWVLEMGAAEDLKAYMPFPDYTREEMLEAKARDGCKLTHEQNPEICALENKSL